MKKCDYCKNQQVLLETEVPYAIWDKIGGYEDLNLIIDRQYLRLVNKDDMQCLDHGEKMKINYCPICGVEL